MVRDRHAAGRRERELVDRIRHAGLRATPMRIAVMGVMDIGLRPVSHGEVAEQLTERTGDRVTVFRALTDLTRVGLLRRLDVGDRTWRFEADRHDLANHPHFVCTSCRSIICLLDVDVVLPKRDVPRSVRARDVQVLVHGRCDDCEAS